MDTTVVIPYKPRTIQKRIHDAMDRRRFVTCVCHRRGGKTVAAINELIKRAIITKPRVNSRPFFGYVAPYLKQAKGIAWDYLKHYTKVIEGRRVNEQELYVEFPNGAKIRLFGADNPDSLRGLGFDGVVLDEVAQFRSETWPEIIRPALADREGWALFIGTPKGINLFSELFREAESNQSGDWAAIRINIYDSMGTPDPPLSQSEVDSQKSSMSDNAWRQEYECDFSASADDVLIPLDLVHAASQILLSERDIYGLPLVFGVDVARFGSDSSVIFRRQGRQAFPPLILQGMSNKEVTERLIHEWHKYSPSAVFIDSGQGQGVIDWVSGHINNVVEVPFGGKPIDEAKFLNRRAEMWYLTREWLTRGGAIPSHEKLMKELAAPIYFYNSSGKIQLEPKDKIKERLGFSPDIADALALTFAQPVLPADPIESEKTYKAIQKSDLWEY